MEWCHVLNRGVDRQRLLSRPSDYEAFEDVVEETLGQIPMRILQLLSDAKSLALCLMARTCWGFCRVHAEIERANLVQHAEEGKWSSLWRRERGTLEQQKCLVAWPLPCPRGWMKYVNDPETEVELNALRLPQYCARPEMRPASGAA